MANAATAVLEFVGYLLTGSPSLLPETHHSISDTGNQVFLLIGIRYGPKSADRRHPFGYGKAQFFYSFLVSVLLFGIAGWESVKHGSKKIQAPFVEGGHQATAGDVTLFDWTALAVYVNYAVLVGAILFESYALYKARATMNQQIEEHD